jgi:chloramphenicol 3-O phosphotransferase
MNRFRSGEFSWAAQRQAFFDGFHTSLAAYANSGNNLIVEHILDTSGWLETLCDLLVRISHTIARRPF